MTGVQLYNASTVAHTPLITGSYSLSCIHIVSHSCTLRRSLTLQVSVAGVKCDLSAADMEFRTALHWAAVLGNSEMVGLLLEKRAPALVIDSVGATPLHYAVSWRELCVIIRFS